VRIEHVALWTHDIEGLKRFYETFFQARASDKYVNAARKFESYFLTFASGARLELMRMPGVAESLGDPDTHFAGYSHIAFSVGSEEQVDAVTARFRESGYRIVDGPRRTGDGYYESVVLDPDGNRIEITV
jgi:lactoylglutathione lyase